MWSTLTRPAATRRDKQWDQAFADKVEFKSDPVVATPDVTEIQLTDDDEFVIVASDGLWYAEGDDSCSITHYRPLHGLQIC